jgi:hypothetical protein
MYVEPQSNIRLLKGVPLDATYEHTIYFNNATDQFNYFISKTKHIFSNVTYNRVNRGVARLQKGADEVYDCNYMMFQNIGFGNKWFYAFINKVEYVNNITCEIEFEIDVMQTWFFDYNLGMNYVEREHSATDTIGDNLLPEPVDLGEYVYNDGYTTGLELNNWLGPLSLVVATSAEPITPEPPSTELVQPVEGGVYNGIYSGLKFYRFDVNAVIPEDRQSAIDSANTFFTQMTSRNASESIVACFMYPTQYFNEDTEPVSKTLKITPNFSTVGGYTPRNKKLFTFPYKALNVTVGTQTNIYKYEYFIKHDNKIEFKLKTQLSCAPQIGVFPRNYKNYGYDRHTGILDDVNTDDGLIINDFPQCAYSIDSYRAWLSQNIFSVSSKMANIGIGAGASLISGNPLSAGVTGATGFTSLMGELATASMLPPLANGNSRGDIFFSNGNMNFNFTDRTITAQFAQRIDDFFDKYGYCCSKLKIPNRNVRPHWCYTKTSNCVLEANSMPADDERKICGIYDKGITFWKNGDEIGNYSLDNTV